MAQANIQGFDRCMRELARIDQLTPEIIRTALEALPLDAISDRQLLKATLQDAVTYRSRPQFGRLRATILTGVTLLGRMFLTQLERTGVLLSSENCSSRFREFLGKLELDARPIEDWSFLRERLQTYQAYDELARLTGRDKRKIEPLLRNRPRNIVKKLLALTHLCFVRQYLEFETPPELADWFDAIGTPEELASVVSLLVVLANQYHPLDSFDLALPDTSDLATAEMYDLVNYGRAAATQHEVGKNISLFGYRLELLDVGRRVLYLRPPSSEFEYAMRLGFIRNEIGGQKAILEVNSKAGTSRFSLVRAAELFATNYNECLCEVKDQGTPLRRVRVKLPLIKDLYTRVMDGGFYEEFFDIERFSQEFLVPLRKKNESEIHLTDDIDLVSFIRIWRYFQFCCFIDIFVLRPFAKSDPTLLCNSLVRITKEADLVTMMTEVGIDSKKAAEFLRLVSADVRRIGYFDLQYRPFLRIATATVGNVTSPPEIMHISAVVGVSNVLRNVQSSNKLRLSANAEVFAEAVGHQLRSRFKNVSTNRQVKSKGESTDLDILVMEGKRLYIFECKHSVPPTGPHEMRDVWEDVEKAAKQLRSALKILHAPGKLHDYVTGWFPGTDMEQTAGLEIVPCVLCSHRIFAGLTYDDIPIRDFSSLSKLIHDGVAGLGVAQREESTLHRFRLIGEAGFSAADLDDYLSTGSKYFRMFTPFMHPISRIEVFGDFAVARETYIYQIESKAWLAHMESLGCVRQPDERTIFTPPWSREELQAKLEQRRRAKDIRPTDGEPERPM
jgi:hypothetical protein